MLSIINDYVELDRLISLVGSLYFYLARLTDLPSLKDSMTIHTARMSVFSSRVLATFGRSVDEESMVISWGYEIRDCMESWLVDAVKAENAARSQAKDFVSLYIYIY